MSNITANLEKVKRNIRQAAERVNRDPSEVTLIAVTKTVPVEKIREAILAGVLIFGENRVLEAREKIEVIDSKAVKWHMIGHLQTNKVKYIFSLFDLIHSVDSLALAHEIDRRAQVDKKKADILVQVNVSGEKTKFGVSKESAVELIKDISRLSNISIKGLMTIPPFSDNPEGSRGFFKELFFIRERVESLGIENVSMRELSMGMSNDYEIAVEEGATMVRVGTAIFGERNINYAKK